MNTRISRMLLLLMMSLSSLLMLGQPLPYVNKSTRPSSFVSVLPGLSSYNFMGKNREMKFIEAYIVKEIKKWMGAIRPGILFGVDHSKPSPEHLNIGFNFYAQEYIESNGAWRVYVTEAKIKFIVEGLDYEYVYSIPNFSVQIGNFSDHVLYSKLLTTVTNRIYSYNRSSALHLADYRSGLNEMSIKDKWKNDGCKLFEGIYENIVSDNNKSSNKYKLAMKYVDDKPSLIYLSGANEYNDWKEGEYKAWLEPTATANIFKAKWLMANKSLSSAYVSFNNSAMSISFAESNDRDTYIKLYPSASDNIAIAGSQPSEWTGTGFALRNNYVVTNFHVVDGAKSISIQGINGSFNNSYSAEVIATDKNNDLAILKVNGVTIPSANIPYSVKTNTAEVGEEVFVLGYPLTSTMGDEIKLTTGVVSSRSGFQGDVSLYQISAPIQPGNSGGPLFDSKGNVIGIVSAKHRGAENVGYAIKAAYLRNLMESAIPNNILPQTNKIATLNLSGKVKSAKNFVYYIICSNKNANGNAYFNTPSDKGIKTNKTNIEYSSKTAEDDYQKGNHYYKSNPEEAVKCFKNAATKGHAKAQYELAGMYFLGRGVKIDNTQGVFWLQKAANQGLAKAQCNLAYLYHHGKSGVKKNYLKAFEWYKKAADQGEAQSQNNIGCLYGGGLGVKQNYTKAVEWFQKAANQNNIDAQYNLGQRYYYGEGITKDYKKAFELFLKAANKGYTTAQYYLGEMYEKALYVEKDYTKAAEWYKKAADQGDKDAKEALKRIEKYL